MNIIKTHAFSTDDSGRKLIHVMMDGAEPHASNDKVINAFLVAMDISSYHFIGITFQEGNTHTMTYVIDEDDDKVSENSVIEALNISYRKLNDLMKENSMSNRYEFLRAFNAQEIVSKKIREAQLSKVNYTVVIGEREKKYGQLSVRTRSNRNYPGIPVDTFLETLKKEIDSKSIKPLIE